MRPRAARMMINKPASSNKSPTPTTIFRFSPTSNNLSNATSWASECSSKRSTTSWLAHHPEETNSSGTLKRHLHLGQTSVGSFVRPHVAGHWWVLSRHPLLELTGDLSDQFGPGNKTRRR